MSIPKPLDMIDVAPELDSMIAAYRNECMKIEISEQHRKLSGEEAAEAKEKAAKAATKRLLRFVINSYILSLND